MSTQSRSITTCDQRAGDTGMGTTAVQSTKAIPQ
jgi:hypothetical protein